MCCYLNIWQNTCRGMICIVPQRQGMPPLHSTQTSETMLAGRTYNMLVFVETSSAKLCQVRL